MLDRILSFIAGEIKEIYQETATSTIANVLTAGSYNIRYVTAIKRCGMIHLRMAVNNNGSNFPASRFQVGTLTEAWRSRDNVYTIVVGSTSISGVANRFGNIIINELGVISIDNQRFSDVKEFNFSILFMAKNI